MNPFPLFGPSHLIALFVITLLGGGLIFACRTAPENIQRKLVTLCAICCLLTYFIQQILWRLGGTTPDLENSIPLHLCDLAAISCGIALLTRRPLFCELAYFWGLAGTLQGLITPTLNLDFPDPIFISFFWKHGFVVITALLLPLGLGWKPRKNAHWRIFGITQIYAAVALIVNFTVGTNFGFLRGKPNTVSLLDALPPWPWYILILEAICITFFLLLRLPFSQKSLK